MKKPSFAWLRAIILLGLFCTLIGAVLAFQAQAKLNTALTILTSVNESASQIDNDLADVSTALDTVDTQLSQIENNLTTAQIDQTVINNMLISEQSARTSLWSARDNNSAVLKQSETLTTSRSQISTALANARTSLQTGLGLTIFGIFLLFISFIITFGIDGQIGKAIKESTEQGKIEGRQEVARVLDQNPSALLNMLYWVYAYKQGKGNSEAALHIFEQIFARMQEKFELRPYGRVGEILSYDHKKQDNRSAGVKNGDRVRVVEAGWQMGKMLLRKPMVEKERS